MPDSNLSFRVMRVGVYIPESNHQYEEGDTIEGADALAVQNDPQLRKRCVRLGPAPAAAQMPERTNGDATKPAAPPSPPDNKS